VTIRGSKPVWRAAEAAAAMSTGRMREVATRRMTREGARMKGTPDMTRRPGFGIGRSVLRICLLPGRASGIAPAVIAGTAGGDVYAGRFRDVASRFAAQDNRMPYSHDDDSTTDDTRAS
jgi:hypothetical protein